MGTGMIPARSKTLGNHVRPRPGIAGLEAVGKERPRRSRTGETTDIDRGFVPGPVEGAGGGTVPRSIAGDGQPVVVETAAEVPPGRSVPHRDLARMERIIDPRIELTRREDVPPRRRSRVATEFGGGKNIEELAGALERSRAAIHAELIRQGLVSSEFQ